MGKRKDKLPVPTAPAQIQLPGENLYDFSTRAPNAVVKRLIKIEKATIDLHPDVVGPRVYQALMRALKDGQRPDNKGWGSKVGHLYDMVMRSFGAVTVRMSTNEVSVPYVSIPPARREEIVAELRAFLEMAKLLENADTYGNSHCTAGLNGLYGHWYVKAGALNLPHYRQVFTDTILERHIYPMTRTRPEEVYDLLMAKAEKREPIEVPA